MNEADGQAPPREQTRSRLVKIDTGDLSERTRVTAVVPCFDRPDDLALLLDDLRSISLPSSIALDVVVVDNASSEPIRIDPTDDGPPVRLIRLSRNLGGSGGFNGGISAALARPADQRPDLVWLVDSDARVDSKTLGALVRTMEREPSAVVVGSVVADPQTSQPFEAGGRVNRTTGEFEPIAPGDDARPDYVAACSALVRTDAIDRVGLMPDTFLNGDDVLWCIRLAQASNGRVLVAPDSIVRHPRFDRFKTSARYYTARNALAPINALRLGPIVRTRRVVIETARAVGLAVIGRNDLSRLHTDGLRDASRGRLTGPAPAGQSIEVPKPVSKLASRLQKLSLEHDARAVIAAPDLDERTRGVIREQINKAGLEVRESITADNPSRAAGVLLAFWRLVSPVRPDVAVVSAKGHPSAWFRAGWTVQASNVGFTLSRTRRLAGLFNGLGALGRCVVPGVRLVLAPPSPPACARPTTTTIERLTQEAGPSTLSIIVLSYNRFSALRRTLAHLTRRVPDAQIVVVDNASTDGTPDKLRASFPDLTLLALEENVGVDGFNRGVDASEGSLVLILDDDAIPGDDALERAVQYLDEHPEVAAVTLHPVHPSKGNSEWPFAKDSKPRNDWPVMGCANLVRRRAWDEVGGYESGFFLYRNDTDLAMKLLAAGHAVHMNPEWVALHDSPAADKKSVRWFQTATRNWVWLARRHARGFRGTSGMLMGWAWAHRLAGARPKAHAAILKGASAGLFRRPPPLPHGLEPDGRAFNELISLQMAARRAR